MHNDAFRAKSTTKKTHTHLSQKVKFIFLKNEIFSVIYLYTTHVRTAYLIQHEYWIHHELAMESRILVKDDHRYALYFHILIGVRKML